MIDRDGPTPLYEQVAREITGRIERGQLQPNRPIPSEPHLAQEYGVARGTVRRAIELLIERGVVVVVRGKGTYVRERPGR